MTIENYKKEVRDSGMPAFDVVNTNGEIIDDSFGIIGFDNLEHIQSYAAGISSEEIGITAAVVLFHQTEDYYMECLGALSESMQNLNGEKEFAYGDSTFDIGDKHYCPGILIRSSIV